MIPVQQVPMEWLGRAGQSVPLVGKDRRVIPEFKEVKATKATRVLSVLVDQLVPRVQPALLGQKAIKAISELPDHPGSKVQKEIAVKPEKPESQVLKG